MENKYLQLGRDLEQQARFEDALNAYSTGIVSDPQNIDLYFARADLSARLGRSEQSFDDITHTISIDPFNPNAWLRKGNLEISVGKASDGILSYQKTLALAPGSVVSMFALATAYQISGQLQDAVNMYQAIVQRHPQHAEALSNLASILISFGLFPQALEFSRRAVSAQPNFANALFNLALCLEALNRPDEAREVYAKVVQISPNHTGACINLGTLLGREGQHLEAVKLFDLAVDSNPEYLLPKVNKGLSLRELGYESDAEQIFADVLEKNPQHLLTSIAHAVTSVPIVLTYECDLSNIRRNFRNRLVKVRECLSSCSASDVEAAVGAVQPYFLAYHDKNNVELMKEYGAIVVEAMSRFQALAQRPAKTEGDRLTVGIVTAHARKHSVWDAITKGLVKLLDRERFRVVLFAVDPRDPCPPEIRPDQGDVFVSGHGSLPHWINAISQQVPDVLVYPEVGMNHRVLQLAGLRLAPRQYAMWGHPETTGLPTIDGYFSGDAFEPDDADKYYTESLIRLPGTASFYEPVASISDDKHDPVTPSDSRPRIVCPSAAFKFQPENDVVFLDIVRANPTARLVFFHMTKRWISERFEARLRRVFSDAGMDFDSHVTFEDWMSPNDFHQYLAGSAVVIDSIGFSGYNTAIQALEVGTPFVAYEGQFMRGRLGAGVLRRIGLDHLVAENRERFVQIVSDVAQNPHLQGAVRKHIVDARDQLFMDRSVISAFEDELLKPSIPARM